MIARKGCRAFPFLRRVDLDQGVGFITGVRKMHAKTGVTGS